MRRDHGVSALAVGVCLALAGGAAQAQTPSGAAVDPRDARINALEREVHEMAAELRAMRAERQASSTWT